LGSRSSSEGRREYIIKIIPDKGEKMHSIRLPMHLIKYGAASCAAAAVLFVGSFGYSVYSAFTAASDHQELRDLRSVNAAQQEQLTQLAKKANELQDEMEKVNEIEMELRQMAGAEPVEEPQDAAQSMNPAGDPAGGQGGPWIEPNARHVGNALDNIRERLAQSRVNLERVHEALQEQQRMIGYQNRLSAYVPSLWPASGEVSSPYGLRWGGSDFHPGIDIANDYGVPIVAAASGTVTAAGWNSGGYGNMVDIDHGNGIWTRYGHAEAVVVTVGETVQKGQLIAYMGSTGFSTGPHVHYEVHANGELVNPILYLGGGE
jgi:murein DD-endopeptidase MepM/ murein hydrolase activator NlpD